MGKKKKRKRRVWSKNGPKHDHRSFHASSPPQRLIEFWVTYTADQRWKNVNKQLKWRWMMSWGKMVQLKQLRACACAFVSVRARDAFESTQCCGKVWSILFYIIFDQYQPITVTDTVVISRPYNMIQQEKNFQWLFANHCQFSLKVLLWWREI